MASMTEGGNGRILHAYTQEQVKKEIERGRITDNDLVFIEETGEIQTKGKPWGGGGSTDDVDIELDEVIAKTQVLINRTSK